MKKIGILFGMEQNFPDSIVRNINDRKEKGIKAEFIKIGALAMNASPVYNVILDRVSGDVPYYKSVLQLAAINGARVVNNPFLSCADSHFLHYVLSDKLKIKVPKTVVLPSKEHPYGTSSDFMRNLVYPLNWEEVFDYVGFPAYIKPNVKNAAQNDYKVYNPREFFAAYDLTGNNVMILQEYIEYDYYFRCYVIGRKDVKIMHFDPFKPHHLRYPDRPVNIDTKLQKEMEDICITICDTLGFDFNAVEIAVRNNSPIAIDFMNPSPVIEKPFMKNESYEWLVEKTSDYLIQMAKERKPGNRNLKMSSFFVSEKPAKKTGKKK